MTKADATRLNMVSFRRPCVDMVWCPRVTGLQNGLACVSLSEYVPILVKDDLCAMGLLVFYAYVHLCVYALVDD